MKNIEDDPNITPGSVARSPLSINPMPKDAAEIFTTNQTNKNSPTDLPPLSLSNTTWTFNPSLSNQNFARLVFSYEKDLKTNENVKLVRYINCSTKCQYCG